MIRIPRTRPPATALLLLLLLTLLMTLLSTSYLLPGLAHAVEIPLAEEGRSMRLGLVQSLITEYHADEDVLDGNPVDRYTDFKNRTNLLLMQGSTTFSMRFDFNLFAGTEEDSPHRDRITLEKIALSSIQRSFEVTAGDVHVRIGRGLALDLTRVDEVLRDTTLRGGQIRILSRYVEGMLYGGWVNPLEVDDLTEMPVDVPQDVIGGGRLEVRPLTQLALGLHYTGGGLEPVASRSRNAIHIIGASLDLPDLLGRLALYGEFNYMSRVEYETVQSGTGTYVSLTGNVGALAALLEFKLYQRFLFHNDRSDAYSPGPGGLIPPPLIYHRPPTLMYKKQEIINNHDVIGPRLRLDYRLESIGTVLWASYGRFFRSDAMVDQGFFDSGIIVNDLFGGIQQRLPGGALDLTGGYRQDIRSQDGRSITDYSQIFVDAELSTRIHGQHSVEIEAQYRQVEKAAESFWDLSVSLGYRPSRYVAGSVTYEYSNEFIDPDSTDEVSVRNHFGGATGTVNITPSSHVRLFVGSTRGGIRCIDGFCRQLPPFIGARLEAVVHL